MQKKPKSAKNNSGKKGHPTKSLSREGDNSTRVGDVHESTGIAIGANAKATVIQIGSLFDFGNLQTLLKNHWGFLVISTLAQYSSFVAWSSFKDRFLIPAWLLVTGMTLIEFILVSFYILKSRQTQKGMYLTLGFISFIGLIGLTGMEYKRVIHPPKFDAETFGVAIAYFGEGPDFKNTFTAREISETVLSRLKAQADERSGLEFVEFRQIGIVRTSEEAIVEGQRIGADLVIWGQLILSEELTSISFEVLESDQVSNPTFPRITPLLKHSISDTILIPGRRSEEIAEATATISGFTFGMAHLSKWDFSRANIAFQQALAESTLQSENDLYLLYFYYGLGLQWPGDLELADKQFEHASELRKDDPAAPLARAYGNRSLGNHEEARTQAEEAYQLINQYIKQYPKDPYAFYDRALAYVIFEEWDLALRDYQTAIQLEPNLYIAYIGAIRIYLELDSIPEAIRASEEAISLAKTKGVTPEWAYFYLAESHARNNDPVRARLAYEQATLFGSHMIGFIFEPVNSTRRNRISTQPKMNTNQ